jgi:nitric oxide dioxygenase
MFRTDPSVQQSKLMDSLDAVMAYLDRPDEQALLLIEMGRRHAVYGAAPAHYRIVAELLSDAVTELLGDKADAQTRQDWLDAFNLVSDHMLAGAETLER